MCFLKKEKTKGKIFKEDANTSCCEGLFALDNLQKYICMNKTTTERPRFHLAYITSIFGSDPHPLSSAAFSLT